MANINIQDIKDNLQGPLRLTDKQIDLIQDMSMFKQMKWNELAQLFKVQQIAPNESVFDLGRKDIEDCFSTISQTITPYQRSILDGSMNERDASKNYVEREFWNAWNQNVHDPYADFLEHFGMMQGSDPLDIYHAKYAYDVIKGTLDTVHSVKGMEKVDLIAVKIDEDEVQFDIADTRANSNVIKVDLEKGLKQLDVRYSDDSNLHGNKSESDALEIIKKAVEKTASKDVQKDILIELKYGIQYGIKHKVDNRDFLKCFTSRMKRSEKDLMRAGFSLKDIKDTYSLMKSYVMNGNMKNFVLSELSLKNKTLQINLVERDSLERDSLELYYTRIRLDHPERDALCVTSNGSKEVCDRISSSLTNALREATKDDINPELIADKIVEKFNQTRLREYDFETQRAQYKNGYVSILLKPKDIYHEDDELKVTIDLVNHNNMSLSYRTYEFGDAHMDPTWNKTADGLTAERAIDSVLEKMHLQLRDDTVRREPEKEKEIEPSL